MKLDLAPWIVIAALSVSCLAASANTTPEKDGSWNKLIAEAIKHGGVETISGKTGSYVFAGPNGLSVTFTRSLDNKVRLVCAGYLSANINVCSDWNTEKLFYGTRANANAPWAFSNVAPDAQEAEPETPFWLDLLSAFLDVDVPYPTFHSWSHGGGPRLVHSAFNNAFSHGFSGGHGGRHR